MDGKNSTLDFLISALHPGFYHSIDEILNWLQIQNKEVESDVRQVPVSELKGWTAGFDAIRHHSGRFFSIDGIQVSTNYGLVSHWEQPIINQREIGFLGMIVKKINSVFHFLVQAKIEPGNLNIVQLSPTLQATRSNYTRVHKGTPPLYLDYFNGDKEVNVLVDQLQSEQGARFLHKRNRNIIVAVDSDEQIELHDNFMWLTLRQIKELLRYPNVVNMDTRTVISCIPFGSYSEKDLSLLSALHLSNDGKSDLGYSFLHSMLSSDNHLHDISSILKWITALKFKYDLNVTNKPLSQLSNWLYDGNSVRHEHDKYFSVIGIRVTIGNREVTSWDQPMVKSAQEGIMGFLIKKINGVYHFLVQAKLEAGNFDIVELAPTVQCLTGNYRKGNNEYSVSYINEFLEAPQSRILYSVYQSEEGGRFYQEQNLNMIVEVDDNFPIEVKENYCWMTLNQLLSFAAYNNYINIAARSLISAIQFY